MTMDYVVAGHRFRLIIPDCRADEFDLSQYAPFISENEGGEPIFTLEVVDYVSEEGASLVYDQKAEEGETKISLWQTAEGFLFKMAPTSEHPESGLLLMSEDWSRGYLQVLESGQALFALNNSLMLQYAFRTADLGTLEVHASVVVNDGKAYLFMAKSGTGKSTHSRMWHKAIPGTRLLNDDNPIVRLLPDGQVIAYGSPWSGKTPCYRNEQYPAGAFVKIVRAPANKLVRLSVFEAYALIYSSSSGFKADKRIADGLYNTISGIVTSIPSYDIECLPNEDAARVCHSGILADKGGEN